MIGECGLDLSDSVQRPVAGSWEHGNETLISMKGKELFQQLSNY
jgi:hypothetical protein